MGRNVAIALAVVVVAVILQTTLFVDLQPFGASPNLVMLVVIGSTRYLDAEPSILLGFTAGLLMDLLGGSPLGMWALVMTVVAYVTFRLWRRFDQAPILMLVGVFAVTFFGEALFVLVGTLFGQQTLSESGLVRILLLTSLYNALLGFLVLPLMSVLLRPPRRRSVLP